MGRSCDLPTSEAVKIHVKSRVWSGIVTFPEQWGDSAQVTKLKLTTEIIIDAHGMG